MISLKRKILILNLSCLKRAGIEDFRWHDLRHTWASWQRQSGTQVHELQKLGGWLTAAMVERYALLAPDHLSDVATRIDSKFPKVTLRPTKNKTACISASRLNLGRMCGDRTHDKRIKICVNLLIINDN